MFGGCKSKGAVAPRRNGLTISRTGAAVYCGNRPYLGSDNPKLRERAVNALGRIGRADKTLILPFFDLLMSMRSDMSDEVRLAFVWACENIATNAPELFCDTLELFYELISDKSERV